MVGAVLVVDGCIVGEGHTQAYGGPHAEVMAIHGVDDMLLKKATLYVSLEPCAHHGKTPPCADLIIDKGIPSVVIGCRDSFEAVDGKGIERLRAAGIDVQVGLLEDECIYQNRRFFTYHQMQRPYVILKWAETTDGYIDDSNQKPLKISNAMSSQWVHQWRSEEQSILIGGKTARKDNPSLSTRLVSGPSPERFVWTSRSLSPDSKLAISGCTVLDFSSVKEVLDALYKAEVQSVLVEGGAQVLQQFIDAHAYDEVRRIVGAVRAEAGVKAPKIDAPIKRSIDCGGDKILYY